MHVANVTIDSSKVSANLTDFPIYIDLADMPSTFWNTVVDTTLENGLESFWKLDESSGNASDLTGKRALTNSNVTYTTGKINNGGDFNGTNARFQGSAWSPTGAYSISAWINPATLPSSGAFACIFNNYNIPSGSTSDRGMDLRLHNDGGTQKIQFMHGPFAGQVTLSHTTTLTTGNWYLLTAVYNQTTVKLYLNGSEVASGNTSTNNPSITKLTNIGNFGFWTPSSGELGRYFDGKIDAIGLWNRALTTSEITELYSSGNGTQAVKSGGDIRVFKSDGTTELPREVVSCDTSEQEGELHVKFTGTLSSSSDTTIQIHADGTSDDYDPDDTYGRNAVWSDYKAVYHLQSNSNDSTATGNNGTNTNISYNAGQIENGAQFSGNGNIITGQKVIPLGAKTVSTWIKTSQTSFTQIIGENQDGNTTNGFSMIMDNDFSILAEVTRSSASKVFAVGLTTGISNNQWRKVDLTWDGTTSSNTAKIYLDGAENNTATAGFTETGTPFRNLQFGEFNSSFRYTGMLDEVRITDSVKSSDWIETEYNNQSDTSTFYEVTSAGANTGNFLAFM